MESRAGASQTRQGETLWTADFVLNMLSAHFMFAGYTSVLTTIPPYVFYRGGDEWHLGIIVGSFGIVGLLIRPFAGQWIYTLGPKRVAVVGTAIVSIGSLSYIGALSFWWLIPMRMLQGVGLALGPVATSTIVANLAPPTRRAEAMAYMGSAINVSFLYAPLTASLILEYGGFHNAFLFSAIVAAIGTLAMMRISASRIAFEKPPQDTARAAEKPPLVSKAAIFPTLVFLTYTFTTAPVNTFLPLLARQENLGNPGLFYTVFSATAFITMTVGGRLADKYGRAAVIIPGLLSVATSMFIMSVAFFPLMLWTAGFFAGLAFGLIQPGIQSLTVDRVSVRERSAGMATLQQAWDIGGSAGAFLMGPIAGVVGMAATFGIAGIGALFGAVGFVAGNAKSPTNLPGQAPAGD